MTGIFINFRGGDGQDRAWGLDEILGREFGKERVFRSSRSIEAGSEFPPALLDGVRNAAVVLVLMGADWLEAGEDGQRKLDNPEDWVRQEIAEALRLRKIVIPVLAKDVRMPAAADLPPDIAGLAQRQYRRLDYRTADQDIAALIQALIRVAPELGIGVVAGLEDLSSWLDSWRQFTNPPLPETLPVLGRDREVEQLCAWLDGAPSILPVYGHGRTEAAAFVATGVVTHRPGLRAVLVSSPAGWLHCRSLTGPYLAVVDTPEVQVGANDAFAGHVIVVHETPDVAGGELLALPRIPRDKATEAFAAAGVPPAEANTYAAIARRSITSLRRKLSPSTAKPVWAQAPERDLVAPLILAGRWSANSAADRTEIAAIIGREPNELDRFLGRTDLGADPLLHRSGARWQLADPQDAWSLLYRSLSAQDLKRWREVADKVLAELDPALTLSAGDQLSAVVFGQVRTWSSALRYGLAQGAALLGAAGDATLVDGIAGADHASGFVRDLLARANADTSGALWQSLTDVLPLLAEAAPREFLEAVDRALTSDPSVLLSMFADAGWRSWSPHTGLLWAVESVCWQEEALPMVITVLAELARIDPGGRTSNRPIESLITLLQPWYPYLDIPVGQRGDLVKAVRRRTPDVGWDLVLALLSGPHGHLLASPHRPQVRLEWTIPVSPVVAAGFAEFHDDLVTVALAALEQEPRRWRAVFEQRLDLTAPQWDRIVEGLTRVDVERLSDEERFQLWNRLTALAAEHRHYAEAGWALPEELLQWLENCAESIEPELNPRRHARLFSWHPPLEGIDPFDHEAHAAEADRLRREAVSGLLREQGVAALDDLAAESDVPRLVGITAAQLIGDEIQEEALDLLGHEEWASGWVGEMAWSRGEEWSSATAKLLEGQDTTVFTAYLSAIPVEHAMVLLDSVDEDVSEGYWSRVGFWPLPDGQEDYFVGELLAYRRPWAAINALALRIHGPEPRPVPASLIDEALNAALEPDADEPDQHARYQVGPLLEFLIKVGWNDVAVAKLELLYHSMLKHHRKPRVLYRILAEDPAAFVDLYCQVHPAEDASPRADLIHAWFAIFEMRTVPGRTGEGLDGAVLKDWVSRARALFAERGRSESGDRAIGTVLAGSPSAPGGTWPAEPVRDVLDVADGGSLREGFAIGMANNRGMTVRDSYEGGQQERDLAQRYRGWARQVNVGWPRVAALLRDYADQLDREGRRNDGQAEQIHDAP